MADNSEKLTVADVRRMRELAAEYELDKYHRPHIAGAFRALVAGGELGKNQYGIIQHYSQLIDCPENTNYADKLAHISHRKFNQMIVRSNPELLTDRVSQFEHLASEFRRNADILTPKHRQALMEVIEPLVETLKI